MTFAEQQIKEQADALIAKAVALGVVLEIETKPLQPLAMGHYAMVANVRTKLAY